MTTPDAPSPDPESQRRLDAITQRFPDRFSDEQIEQIRARVTRSIALGQTLASHRLPNGIDPHFYPRPIPHE